MKFLTAAHGNACSIHALFLSIPEVEIQALLPVAVGGHFLQGSSSRAASAGLEHCPFEGMTYPDIMHHGLAAAVTGNLAAFSGHASSELCVGPSHHDLHHSCGQCANQHGPHPLL